MLAFDTVAMLGAPLVGCREVKMAEQLSLALPLHADPLCDLSDGAPRPLEGGARFIIYGLTDPRTGMVRYIGQSSLGMRRPRIHRTPSVLSQKHGLHKSRWIKQLQALGLEYGIVVIEELPTVSGLDERERWWIAFALAWGLPLTNATSGGESTRGWHHGQDARQRMSIAKKGRVIGPEWRRRISEAGKGRSPSAETRAKIGAGHLGMIHGPDTRARISLAKQGRKMSAEARAKMSKTRRGRRLTPEHIEKLRHRTISVEQRAAIAAANHRRGCSAETRTKLAAVNTGKKATAETRAKMSLSHKHRWQVAREALALAQSTPSGAQ